MRLKPTSYGMDMLLVICRVAHPTAKSFSMIKKNWKHEILLF